VIRELQTILSEAEEEYKEKAKKKSVLRKLITVERGFASPTAKSDDQRCNDSSMDFSSDDSDSMLDARGNSWTQDDETDDAKKQVETSVHKVGGDGVKLPVKKLDDRGSSWTQDDETDSPLPVKKENIGEDGKGWNSSSDEEHDAPIESVGSDLQLPVKKEDIGEDGKGWNSSLDEEHDAPIESVGGDSQLLVKKEDIGEDG
jgi:hypothetical protein